MDIGKLIAPRLRGGVKDMPGGHAAKGQELGSLARRLMGGDTRGLENRIFGTRASER
jgi:hypothetical protein